MKKLLALLMALAMMVSVAACGGGDAPAADADAGSDAENAPVAEEKQPEKPADPYQITDCKSLTYKDSIGSNWVQVIVEITNTGNDNLYLSSGSYDLEDADGNLVASNTLVSQYPNVLAPGEKGYMYEENILDEAPAGELTVIPRVEVEKAKVDLIRFPVTDLQVKNSQYGGVKLLGRVENPTDEAMNMVYVVAFLYDADGACIGSVFTILMDELGAGEKVGFEMEGMSLPDNVKADAVADVVCYAYPEQFQF